MELINKIENILTKPTTFFKNLKKEKGIEKALIYLLIVVAISSVLSFIVNLFWEPFSSRIAASWLGLPFIPSQPPFWLMLAALVASYIFIIAFSFVLAGIVHVWILIWGGKESYLTTYKLVVYSSTPSWVFGWIPIIGSLTWIYDLVLIIIGTQYTHGLSRTKSVWMYLIPVIVIIILVILAFIFLITLFSNETFMAMINSAAA